MRLLNLRNWSLTLAAGSRKGLKAAKLADSPSIYSWPRASLSALSPTAWPPSNLMAGSPGRPTQGMLAAGMR